MKERSKQVLKVLSFFILFEAATIGLLLIVPRGRLLLAAMALSVGFVCLRSLWRMSAARMVYVDYDEGLLIIPQGERQLRVPLGEIGRANWRYRHMRQDKKVSYLDLLKMLGAGLFLEWEGKLHPLDSRISAQDYGYLMERNGAPLAVLARGKRSYLLYLGEDSLEAEGLRLELRCAKDRIEAPETILETGVFRKRAVSGLELGRFGRSVRIGKTDFTCEPIRPAHFI
jgi:hypothetical protein